MEREPPDEASLDEAEVEVDPELKRASEGNGQAGASWLGAIRDQFDRVGVEPKPQTPLPEGPPKWRPDPRVFSLVPEESVTAAVLGDAADPIDALGFEPYVKSLADFLTSPKTEPPLTVSLEGEWGSGKSSFMIQLRERIRNERGDNRSYFVDFNAWRYEKEEALWAAFALNFVRAMRRQVGPLAAIGANLKLLVTRIDRGEGLYRIVRTILGLVVFSVVVVAAFLQGMDWLHLERYEPGWWGSFVGVAGVLGVAWKKAWDRTAFAFEHDLTKCFDAPDYRGNRAFIETFSDDFSKIVRAYIPEKGRVFVFIDDLDRCEVPRAANLLQALNLMLPAGGGAEPTGPASLHLSARDRRPPPIVYVLGLDRRLVSAAVAATFEKQIPYLGGDRPDTLESSRAALELASEYLDKFVQVPFRMPVPTDAAVKRYVAKITAPAEVVESKDASDFTSPSQADSLWVEAGTESESVRNVVEMVALLFANNPRRIKQFLNVFRLQAHIADRTALFRRRESLGRTLTLPKLAKVTAIFLRYPMLANLLREQPQLLGKLQKWALAPDTLAAAGDDPLAAVLAARPALVRLLALNGGDDTFRLDELDVTHLLTTVPAQPRRGLSLQRLKQFEEANSKFLELLES
ncbi:MAG: P-loop NTPase fold protein [Vulcanimicrobiaceae bacterium]